MVSNINICQYWSIYEPIICSHWDSSSKTCTYVSEDKQTADYAPYCNLLGTQPACNQYEGTGEEPRCILPDPKRHVCNRKTGKKWVCLNSNGNWTFSDITCYGEDGKCDGCGGIGEGRSFKCSGYSPYYLAFGMLKPSKDKEVDYTNFSTIDDFELRLPFSFEVYNRRAELGRCFWWRGNATLLSIDTANYAINNITSLCGNPDEIVRQFNEFRIDEDLGMYAPPCNGANSECPRYTSIPWEYCINSKMSLGDKILAEQVLELRYYLRKDKWTEELYNKSFKDPIIYAWTGRQGTTVEYSESGLPTGRGAITTIKVNFNSFESFDLCREKILLTAGIPTEDCRTDYPTLIDNLKSASLGPIIRNVFENDTIEVVDMHHKYIDIFGDCFYYNSKVYGINLSDPDLSFLPSELLDFDNMDDIESAKSVQKYNEFYNNIDNILEKLINLHPEKVVCSSVGTKENFFYIPMSTFWGDNNIFIFDKGGGSWTYDKIKVKKVFCGGVIAQTSFVIEGDGGTIGYLPMYESNFMASQNDNAYITFSFLPFEIEDTPPAVASNIYNDSVIRCTGQSDYDVEMWYKLYKVRIFDTLILSVSNGSLNFFGNSGYALIIIPDDKKELHNIYKPWCINETEDSKVTLTLSTTDNAEESHEVEMEVYKKGIDSLEVNQIIIRPKDINKFIYPSKDAVITIDSIYVYDKKSFGETPNGDHLEEEDKLVAEKYGTGYEALYKESVELINISDNTYELRKFGDDMLLISVVFRGGVNGRIKGITRTKMLMWVRQPYCRDVELWYSWSAKYGSENLLPINYYRFDKIEVRQGPDVDIHYTPTYDRFALYPYIDFPCNAYYYFPSLAREVTRLTDIPIEAFEIGIDHGFFDVRMVGPANSIPGVWYIPSDYYGGYLSGCFTRYARANYYKITDDVFEGKGRYRGGLGDGEKMAYYKYAPSAVGTCVKCYANFIHEVRLGIRTDLWRAGDMPGDDVYYHAMENAKRFVAVGDYDDNKIYLKDITISEEQLSGTCPICNNEVVNILIMPVRLPVKFGNVNRDFIRSFRCFDNLYYGKIGTIDTETYPEVQLDREIGIQQDDFELEEYYKKWFPIYYAFSNVNITDGIKNYPFDLYTVDLASPFIHPMGLYTVDNIEDTDINEVISEDRYEFDDVFEVNSLDEENDEKEYSLIYPMVSNLSSINKNKMWYTFKDGSKAIQWAWQEYWKPIERQAFNTYFILLDNNISEIKEITASSPFKIEGSELIGKFLFLDAKYPDYRTDEELKEHRLVCDEGNHELKLNFVVEDEEENSLDTSIFTLQLDDGPVRAFDINGNWDINEDIGNQSLYKICTKDPWVESVTLFATGHESESPSEDRTIKLEQNDLYYQRGLNIELVPERFDYLPKKQVLINPDEYEIKFSDTPSCSKNQYSVIEPEEWYPGDNRQLNIIYCCEDYNSVGISFDFSNINVGRVSKFILEFSFGAQSEIDEYTDSVTNLLYHIPAINILGENNEVIEHYSTNMVLSSKDSDFEIKQKIIELTISPEDMFIQNNILKINFRIKPNSSEIENANLIKYYSTIKHLVGLKTIYIYNSSFCNATESIKTYERKYRISEGSTSSFVPNKLYPLEEELEEVEDFEEYPSANRKVEKVLSTVYQIDCEDGIVGHAGSDGDGVSINKCRGRIFKEIRKDKEELDGISNIYKWERKQAELFNDLVESNGDTWFLMNSICPPGLEEVLNDIGISFPSWTCEFLNTSIALLSDPLQVENYNPPGHFFDWDFSNIHEEVCLPGLPPGYWFTGVTTIFDGYNLIAVDNGEVLVGNTEDNSPYITWTPLAQTNRAPDRLTQYNDAMAAQQVSVPLGIAGGQFNPYYYPAIGGTDPYLTATYLNVGNEQSELVKTQINTYKRLLTGGGIERTGYILPYPPDCFHTIIKQWSPEMLQE